MKVLLFDDDESTVTMLRQSISWEKFGIDSFISAFHINEAKEAFLTNGPIHLMILDIEAPGGTGLDLLKWTRMMHYQTQCVFLTSHADFAYAQQAIELGASGFVLKLSPLSILEEAVGQAIAKVNQQIEINRLSYYKTCYESNHATMKALFWKRLLSRQYSHDNIVQLMQEMHLQIDLNQNIGLCVLSFLPFDQSDTQVQEACQKIQNTMSQRLSLFSSQACVVYEDGERYMLWGVLPVEESGVSVDSILRMLRQLLYEDDISPHPLLDNAVVSPTCQCDNLYRQRMACIERVKDNVDNSHQAVLLDQSTKSSQINRALTLPTERWQELLLDNQPDALLNDIILFLNDLIRHQTMNRSVLASFYTDYMQFLFSSLQKQHLSAHDVFATDGHLQMQAPLSVYNMKKWIHVSVARAVSTISTANEYHTITDEVKEYIDQNACNDLSRKTISAHFYINEDHLSRIFNKKYGMSIPHYITHVRMEKAKQLLRLGQSVSDVAIAVGYDNFSYFTQSFRKTVGVTPAAYRRQLKKKQSEKE